MMYFTRDSAFEARQSPGEIIGGGIKVAPNSWIITKDGILAAVLSDEDFKNRFASAAS